MSEDKQYKFNFSDNNKITVKLDNKISMCFEKHKLSHYTNPSAKLSFYDETGKEIDIPNEVKLYSKIHDKYRITQHTLNKKILYWMDDYKIYYNNVEVVLGSKKYWDISVVEN